MHTLRALTAASLLSVLSFTAHAGAQDFDAPAVISFERGVEHMEAGRFSSACPLIELSYRQDPLPGTLFTLAECETNRGRIATAVARYEEYLFTYSTLTSAVKAKQGTRESESRAQIDALRPKVPRLTLVFAEKAPDGIEVRRDGAVVARTAIGVGIAVDPGEHVITTQVPGGLVTVVRVTIKPGEKKKIALEVKAPEPVSTPAEDTGWGTRKTVMVASGGVGLAGILVGVISGALAIGRKGATTDGTGVDATNCSGAACSSEGKQAADSSQTLWLMSAIGFGVGISGVGVAGVLWFTEPSKETGAKAAQTERRISLGVTAAGDGAAIGVRGVW